jgi:glutamyl-tRNA reductase
LGLEQLPENLEHFDLVISATGASLPIIGKGMVEQALRRRKHAPMFLVDLAVPRDIEPEITSLRDVYLYSLDDLQNIVSENMDLRRSAAVAAEAIVRDAAITYAHGEKTRAGQDLVVRYRKQLEDLKDTELAKAIARAKQGDDIDSVLKTLATQLTQKLAHTPSVGLKSLIIDGDVAAIEQAKTLLGLNQDDNA